MSPILPKETREEIIKDLVDSPDECVKRRYIRHRRIIYIAGPDEESLTHERLAENHGLVGSYRHETGNPFIIPVVDDAGYVNINEEERFCFTCCTTGSCIIDDTEEAAQGTIDTARQILGEDNVIFS